MEAVMSWHLAHMLIEVYVSGHVQLPVEQDTFISGALANHGLE
jgi:hypothetical protein